MSRWLVGVSLASALVVSCIGDTPTYQAYLINQYHEALYVMVPRGDKPFVYVAAADPTVAQFTVGEYLGFSTGLDSAEVTLRRADCSTLATVRLNRGIWTVVIDEGGVVTVASGVPTIAARVMRYDQTACAGPPMPTSIP